MYWKTYSCQFNESKYTAVGFNEKWKGREFKAMLIFQRTKSNCVCHFISWYLSKNDKKKKKIMVISLTDVKQWFPFLEAKISTTVLTAHQGIGYYDSLPCHTHFIQTFYNNLFCNFYNTGSIMQKCSHAILALSEAWLTIFPFRSSSKGPYSIILCAAGVLSVSFPSMI